MKSLVEKHSVEKHSIVIGGHKTYVSLEGPFWSGLKVIAKQRKETLSELVNQIDVARTHGNLSSAIRLFVLSHYRQSATAQAEHSHHLSAETAGAAE